MKCELWITFHISLFTINILQDSMNRSRSRVVNRLNQSESPLFLHAEGDNTQDKKEKNANVLGNVTSIIGSLSSGVSSVFNALAFKKQAEMANQANLNDRRNNWTIWLVGGAILLVVVLILMRKK